MRKIKIALGKSAKSNLITNREVSVQGFFKELKAPTIRVKKDGPYFVMAEFSDDKRRASNLVAYHGATVDLDDTDLSLRDIKRIVRGQVHAIYTTHSHVLKGNRYRVVLPYSKPVKPSAHKATMRTVMKLFGVKGVDVSSKTLSLPMYLPACPSERKQHFACYQSLRGKLLVPNKETDEDIFDEASEVEPLNINASVGEGERNIAITRFTGRLINNGGDLESTTLAAIIFNETKLDPPLPEDEIRNTVASIFSAHKRNSGDLGWGYDELIRRIDVSKDIHKDYKELIRIIALNTTLSRSEREIATKRLKNRTGLTLAAINDEMQMCKKDNAVRLDEDEEDPSETQKSLKEMKKDFANWVYVASDDKWYNIENAVDLKGTAFNNKYKHLTDDTSISSLLLKYRAAKIVDRTQFNPSEEETFSENGIDYVNTFIPNGLKARKGDVGPLVRHMQYLLEDPNQVDIMLDYIAFLVQHPGEKVLWMPVVKGMKRIGKSMIADYIIRPVIGVHNVMPVDTKQIGGDFNSWQTGKQLIVFHELRAGDNRSRRMYVTDTMKSFITDPWIMMHRKGLDPYQVKNLTNSIAFTNYEDAIMITRDEQRFCMMRSEAIPKSRRYYSRFIDWTKTNTREMLYYFKNRDLSNFNNTSAPLTDYTEEIKGNSSSWPSNIIQDSLNHHNSPFNTYPVFTWSEIIQFLRDRSEGEDVMTLDSILSSMAKKNYIVTNVLGELGFRKWVDPDGGDTRMMVHKKQEAIWIPPRFIRKFTKLQRRGIRRELRKDKALL